MFRNQVRIAAAIFSALLVTSCTSAKTYPEMKGMSCSERYEYAVAQIAKYGAFETTLSCDDQITGMHYYAKGTEYRTQTIADYEAEIAEKLAAYQKKIIDGLADQTVTTKSTHFGYQVEYHSPEGGAYLWHPGNKVVVIGQWKVQDVKLCYKYGANTYNPATKETGGTWKCHLPGFTSETSRSTVEGDVFNLMSGKVPYILDRNTGPKEMPGAPEWFNDTPEN